MMRWTVVAFSGGVLVSVAAPRDAEACGPVPCVNAKLVGYGEVPANFPGVFWRPLVDSHLPDAVADPTKISLIRFGHPETLLPFTPTQTGFNAFLLVPVTALTVGETYVIDDATVCTGQGPSGSPAATARFTVGPPAPMPTTLGTLTASDLVVDRTSVPGAFSNCDVGVTAATQTVQLTLSPDAVPWKNLLQFEVSVDDQPFTPSRYEDHSGDTVVRIYHTCPGADLDADSGASGGSHVVRMRGTIAGTTMTVTSATATIDLDCGGASGAVPDHNTGEPGPAGDGGCTAAGPGASPWLGLALGAWLVGRRRRR